MFDLIYVPGVHDIPQTNPHLQQLPNNFFFPQMRLKLLRAPQLQTPGASADREPSVSRIRPAKSANAVPSKCD